MSLFLIIVTLYLTIDYFFQMFSLLLYISNLQPSNKCDFISGNCKFTSHSCHLKLWLFLIIVFSYLKIAILFKKKIFTFNFFWILY